MIHTVIFFCLMIALSGAESITRAYYIGTHEPRDREFAMELLESAKKIQSPPFQSPLFRAGDSLLDTEDYWTERQQVPPQLQNAIYNSTTGYLVLRGDNAAHVASKPLLHQIKGQLQIGGLMSFEFFERDGLDEIKLLAMTSLVQPGQESQVSMGAGPNKISLTKEIGIYQNEDYLEVRLNLEGIIRNEKVQFRTGLAWHIDRPLIIPLGKTRTEQKPLYLRIKGRKIYDGALLEGELTLDENALPKKEAEGPLVYPKEIYEGIKEAETEKALQGFALPPAIEIQFVQNGKEETQVDPFGDQDSKAPRLVTRLDVKTIKSLDPRIGALPSDTLFDISHVLVGNGVSLADDDFAVLFDRTDTLFVRANMDQIELIEGIVGGTVPHIPRMIEIRAYLLESNSKVDKSALGDLNERSSRMIGTIVLPGQKSRFEIDDIRAEFEAVIDTGEPIIELRLAVQDEDSAGIQVLENGLTLVSGSPSIVHAAAVNDRWHTLVMTATILDFKPENENGSE